MVINKVIYFSYNSVLKHLGKKNTLIIMLIWIFPFVSGNLPSLGLSPPTKAGFSGDFPISSITLFVMVIEILQYRGKDTRLAVGRIEFDTHSGNQLIPFQHEFKSSTKEWFVFFESHSCYHHITHLKVHVINVNTE